MERTIVIGGEISLTHMIDGDSELTIPCDGEEGIVIQYDSHAQYTGAYQITPTSQAQTIPIADLIAAQDIIIEPIPQNYGLIGWNGSFLTIS